MQGSENSQHQTKKSQQNYNNLETRWLPHTGRDQQNMPATICFTHLPLCKPRLTIVVPTCLQKPQITRYSLKVDTALQPTHFSSAPAKDHTFFTPRHAPHPPHCLIVNLHTCGICLAGGTFFTPHDRILYIATRQGGHFVLFYNYR